MNLVEQRSALQTQIDGLLAKPSMTASERKTCDALLSKVADLRAQEERQARLDAVLHETRHEREENQPEYRAAKIEGAFNFYVRTGDASALRTYSPEDSTLAGVLIPQGFYAAYNERLKSFSGVRQVSNVITTRTGNDLKAPFSDDSNNDGERLSQGSLPDLANPTWSDNVFGAFTYSSKGIQFSNQLFADSGVSVTSFLQNIFSKRIGRVTNREFTLGAVGGPTGLIPSATQIQTTASPTAVTVAEVIGLQDGLDESLLDGAVYMLHPSILKTLRAMTNTDGLPVFPELRGLEKVLCGYPYSLNVDQPSSFSASTKGTIAFGNFKRASTIREVVPTLVVSRERFAEQNLMYASLLHRQDFQVVDVTAYNVLQQHA